MKKIALALAMAGVLTPAIAYADIGIDLRQADQQRQIDAGKRSGKLSRSERDILTNEQRRIKTIEGRLRARGGFGNRDEARIQAMLDQAQAHINRLKRNRVRGRNGIHF
jgi:hypothetical protein